jgi:GNAT superfamily N-acetyltransferase
MRAELATMADVASWLEIVREVEPLFGWMPDFEATLLRKIDQRAALCVRSQRDSACVLGGLLLGGKVPHGWVRWLAVRSSARRIGIGQCLVEEAIERMEAFDRVSVDTFRDENT